VWVTEGTQYMLWDWIIIQNFSRYGIYFDQLSGNPGHYLLNSAQVSIPDSTNNVTAIYLPTGQVPASTQSPSMT